MSNDILSIWFNEYQGKNVLAAQMTEGGKHQPILFTERAYADTCVQTLEYEATGGEREPLDGNGQAARTIAVAEGYMVEIVETDELSMMSMPASEDIRTVTETALNMDEGRLVG